MWWFFVIFSNKVVPLYLNAYTLNSLHNFKCSCSCTKPEPHKVKLNVDASFHTDVHAGSVDAILHDYQGNLLVAKCSFIPHVASQ
jgi:hypothetical protein